MICFQALADSNGQKFIKFKDAYGEKRVIKNFPGTGETWKIYSGYAQPPIMCLINFFSKKLFCFGMKFGCIKKALTFYFCFYNYLLGKATAAALTDRLNLEDIEEELVGDADIAEQYAGERTSVCVFVCVNLP